MGTNLIFLMLLRLLHHNLSAFISNYSKSYTHVHVISGIWLTEEIILRVWGLPLVPLLNVLIVSSLENICVVSDCLQGRSISFPCYLSPTVRSSTKIPRLSVSPSFRHNSQEQHRAVSYIYWWYINLVIDPGLVSPALKSLRLPAAGLPFSLYSSPPFSFSL